MIIHVDVAGGQIVGSRDHQEDFFVIHRDVVLDDKKKGILAILCDGMGGHSKGEIASKLACETFYDRFINYAELDLRDRLHFSLVSANDAIQAAVKENPEYSKMGTTLVALVIYRNLLHWISVGDSPLWLKRKRKLRRLNADHSMAPVLDKLAEIGEITAEEAISDKGRNQLRSALTGSKVGLINISNDPLTLASGDEIVLASDGLKSLETDEISHLLSMSRSRSAEIQTLALLEEVSRKNQNSQDNTTVVILKCDSKARKSASKLMTVTSKIRSKLF
ncbi:MAG: protein phosphatase 2C domain-containing protein [Aestuariivita sp.]|nr:protein phosphatase 2C domain-containing protein [Aestuariivita sp.]